MSSTATADYPSLTLEVDFSTGVATAAATWTDITAYLRSGTVTLCGRQRELDRFQAGTATFALDNRDRRFDPLHATGPYFGGLKPLRQIRLRATWSAVTYDIWRGYVDGWPQSYPETGMDSVVEVTATDGFVVLGRAQLPDSVWATTIRSLADLNFLWWRLGEDSGTTMGDSSANALHGTYEGGATFNHRTTLLPFGTSGGAIEFNGADMLGRAPPGAGTGNGDFTLVLLAKMPDVIDISGGTGLYPTLARQDPGNLINTHSIWLLYISPLAGSTHPAGCLVFQCQAVSDAFTNPRWSDAAMVAGRTYMIAITYDSAGPTAIMYINGVAQTSGDAGAGQTTDSIKGVLRIGGETSAYFDSFNGTLSEVALWATTTLTAGNISTIYDSFSAPWDGDTAGVRIGRLLDSIGWPASLRDLDAGTSVLGPAVLGGNALEACQLVEQTEAGLFYIDGAGLIVFVSRTNLRSEARFTTSNATFGDSTGEIPYTDVVSTGYDLVSIINAARVGRVGGTIQQAEDAASEAEYGESWAADETGLLMGTDGEALDRATWKVIRYKDPHFRVDSIDVFPRGTPTTAWPQVLGRKIGDRVTVKRRPLGVGTVISQDVHIESISHDFSPLDWTTRWALSAVDANESLYWQIGAGSPRNQIGTAKVGY